MASSEWYYTSGGEQQGPTSASNIIGWIKAGTLTSTDRVWQEGLDNWVAISDVPEFRTAISPAAPHRTAGGGGGSNAFCRECGASINRRAVICTQCGVPTDPGSDPFEQLTGRGSALGTIARQQSGSPKSKTVAALLALFLGGLGGHHFYLGNIVLGVIYLLFCMTFIPSIVALIECIGFLCMTEEAFNVKYNS
jgi:TM2 domain-containing membrane protein YozV